MVKIVEPHSAGYSIGVKRGHLFDLIFLITVFFAAGCGYSFQGSKSGFLRDQGILTVYLEPTRNHTYKNGVDMVVHNALLRTVAARRSVRVVTSREEADAILSSAVTTAQYAPAGTMDAKDLGPTGYGFADRLPRPASLPAGFRYVSVANIYGASLSCSFSLDRRVHSPGKRDAIWSGGFGRSQGFPGSNTLDVTGVTSSLINESEFDRVVVEMARQIVTDAHDAMVAAF